MQRSLSIREGKFVCPIFNIFKFSFKLTKVSHDTLLYRVQLEPAKPFEKKSDLMKKMNAGKPAGGDTAAAPPPDAKAAAQKNRQKEQAGQLKNGAAYQVYNELNNRNIEMMHITITFEVYFCCCRNFFRH